MDPTVRRRRRPALSCRECRRRKIRCDHNNPCANCARHKTQCVYKLFTHDDSAGRPRPGSSSTGLKTTTAAATTKATTTTTTTTTTTESPPSVNDSAAPVSETARNRSVPFAVSLSGFGSVLQVGQDPASDARVLGHIADHARGPKDPSILSQTGISDKPAVPVTNIVLETERDQCAPTSRQLGIQEWQPLLNKQRDWGRTRWVGDATEFSVIMTCYTAIMGKEHRNPAFQTPEVAALIAEASQALQACKNSAKGIKVTRPTRGLPNPYAFLAPHSSEVSTKMAKLYFENFESTHRILHAPTFWAEYQKFWDHPMSITEEVRHIILLVIGIGSSLYEHPDAAARQHNTETVHHWIYAAETWLSGPLEKDRLDMAGLQIHCLTMLARQIFSIGGDTVWVSSGSLLNAAMQIGMHRDPKHLPAMSLLQAELRRRLWATVLELVVQSSLDAWMPPRISLDEFDTEPPSNINDGEINESTTVLRPHPRGTFTSTSIQITMLASLPTRLHIVQFLNGLNSDRSYQRALALTAELTSSIQAYTAVFAAENDANRPGSTPFHRNLLDYLTRRFLLPLHFPFTHRARTNPLFNYSRKVSLDAALALSYPEKQSRRRRRQKQHAVDGPDNPENEEEEEQGNGEGDDDEDDKFARLLSTAGGMFRDGLRCATAAVSLELLAHVEAQRRDGSLRRSAHVREALTRVISDLLARAEDRIAGSSSRQHFRPRSGRSRSGVGGGGGAAGAGDTNVKSHMFLCMVLAQVRAIEEEDEGDGAEPIEVKVAFAVTQAARDSLRFCRGLLEARAAAEGNLAAGSTAGGGGMESAATRERIGTVLEPSAESSTSSFGDDGGLGFGGMGLDGMPGFDFNGFGEEFAWESFFLEGRVC